MAIAAIPGYIPEKSLAQASPGMRFGMYLPIWSNRQDQETEVDKWAKGKSCDAAQIRQIREGDGMDAAIAYAMSRRNSFPRLWEKNPYAANKSWKQIIGLNPSDLTMIQHFRRRQQLLASMEKGDAFTLFGQSTAPFTTGLGNEHPLENGFAFLWPYGLPYLPGSGVKGVIRQAARELTSGEWGDSRGWSNEKRFEVRNGKKLLELSTIDLMLGVESTGHQTEQFRGLLSFWDVMPEIKGKRLMVEIMTPHQTHYYQGGKPPHDSGQPVPIQFLTVPPGSDFTFHVVCDLPRLQRLAPELADKEQWKTLLQAAFDHAFDWLGFGAKTAVGYGAMQLDPANARRQQREAARQRAVQEEQARQEQAAAEAARRKAEYEAQPEPEKQYVTLQRRLKTLPKPIRKDQYSALNGAVKEYLDAAISWSLDERKRAVLRIREIYDGYSAWSQPGQKSAKKKKQREKKEQQLNKLLVDG